MNFYMQRYSLHLGPSPSVGRSIGIECIIHADSPYASYNSTDLNSGPAVVPSGHTGAKTKNKTKNNHIHLSVLAIHVV